MVFAVYRFLELMPGNSYENTCTLETQPHIEAYIIFLLIETVSGFVSAVSVFHLPLFNFFKFKMFP